MPRFNFKCQKCSKEIVIYVQSVKDVDPAFVTCEADKTKMALIEFSMQDEVSTIKLQAQIKELQRRIEELAGDTEESRPELLN